MQTFFFFFFSTSYLGHCSGCDLFRGFV